MDFKDDIVIGGSGIDSLTVTDIVAMDFDFGTDRPALSSAGIDTITIDDLTFTPPVTLPSSSVYTISTGGGGGSGILSTGITGTGHYTNGTTGTGYTWTQPYAPAVNITNNGVEVKEGGDIKIGNHSMKEFMTKMEERLSILVPNPGLEDRWEQLKELRTQYLELEKDLLEQEKIMKILKES